MLRPATYAAAVLCTTAGVHGAIINVGPGQSIQSAINIASNGDTILVAPGTYDEAIDFVGKAITVRSSGGPAVTVIDASGLGDSAVTCASDEGADAVLDGFTITGGEGKVLGLANRGGGMYIDATGPTVRNCTFVDNAADEGGAIYNLASFTTITDCVFRHNSASGQGGGGIYTKAHFYGVISNCSFVENEADSFGGGMLIKTGFPWVVNCEFYGNTATFGGGVNCSLADATLVNCTFSGNTAVVPGAALTGQSSDPVVYNSIFWDNSPSEIYGDSGSTITVNSCNVMGGWDGAGSNNMNQLPMFADPSSGDLHLLPGSPCINEGDDAAVPGDIDTDLDGLPRFVGTVDLGPYEVQGGGDPCPADVDDDGLVGVNDFLDLLAYWGAAGGPADINGDGMVGVNDFLDLLAAWGPCP